MTDIAHEGKDGQYDFMAEADGQIPEEFENPGPPSDCKSQEARGEGNLNKYIYIYIFFLIMTCTDANKAKHVATLMCSFQQLMSHKILIKLFL